MILLLWVLFICIARFVYRTSYQKYVKYWIYHHSTPRSNTEVALISSIRPNSGPVDQLIASELFKRGWNLVLAGPNAEFLNKTADEIRHSHKHRHLIEDRGRITCVESDAAGIVTPLLDKIAQLKLTVGVFINSHPRVEDAVIAKNETLQYAMWKCKVETMINNTNTVLNTFHTAYVLQNTIKKNDDYSSDGFDQMYTAAILAHETNRSTVLTKSMFATNMDFENKSFVVKAIDGLLFRSTRVCTMTRTDKVMNQAYSYLTSQFSTCLGLLKTTETIQGPPSADPVKMAALSEEVLSAEANELLSEPTVKAQSDDGLKEE